MRKSGGRTLLMGGQACVFYGAAEFSRDLDLLVLTEPENLNRIEAGLAEMLAKPIAVPVSQPPLNAELLERGHAFHFRCERPDVENLRIDIMSVLRGVAPFEELWERRTTIELDGQPVDLMSIEDLVKAKQTQRTKDWPMIERLVDRLYFDVRNSATSEEIRWVLQELRTPETLIEAVRRFPAEATQMATARSALLPAIAGDSNALFLALRREQDEIRALDKIWWDPLKKELEQFRHGKQDR